MSRRKSLVPCLCVTLLLIAVLPVFAAAVRGRPQGPYRYTLDFTNTFRGQSESGRDNGELNLTAQRIVGQNKTGTSLFVLNLDNRLTRAASQTRQATGSWTIIDPRFGVNRGTLDANARVQKTRTGQWKLTGNYTGTITSGAAKGARQTGRFTAKSI